jgi:ankyrin repeat protein
VGGCTWNAQGAAPVAGKRSSFAWPWRCAQPRFSLLGMSVDDTDVVRAAHAAHHGTNQVLEQLVTAKPALVAHMFKHIDGKEGTLLHISSRYNNLEGVALLLDRHAANVNARNPSGVTPLHIACFNGLLDVVKGRGFRWPPR